jgi:hypothetical protein
MHKTSYQLMTYFRDKYLPDMLGATVLDVGARNLKRESPKAYSYRPLFDRFQYAGMDIEPGYNVDIVGFENIPGPFDVLISGQTMEHVKQPWEWLKSLTPYFSKYICIIAPHTWKEHKNVRKNCPFDTYRYYPDGMRDLFEYAGIKEVEIQTSRYDTMAIGTKNGVGLISSEKVQFVPRPITSKEMKEVSMRMHSMHWTICEVLRSIYAVGKEINSEEIMDLSKKATIMAKRMNSKLKEYKEDYDKEFWELKPREERN